MLFLCVEKTYNYDCSDHDLMVSVTSAATIRSSFRILSITPASTTAFLAGVVAQDRRPQGGRRSVTSSAMVEHL